MRKLLALLLCLLLVASVLAKPSKDPVSKCISKKKCAKKKYKPVCAQNVAAHDTYGGFPNKCYMNCANAGKDLGVDWKFVEYYWPPKMCKTEWLNYPEECSTCPDY